MATTLRLPLLFDLSAILLSKIDYIFFDISNQTTEQGKVLFHEIDVSRADTQLLADLNRTESFSKHVYNLG